MQYRKDKYDNELSVLGFGCMRFPPSKQATEKLICNAVDAGVNYFDTAYMYMSSEATLGGILSAHGLRDKVNVATKLPHKKCHTYEDFDKLFLEELKRLNTGYVDYYLIHNIADMESWKRLQDLGIERWIADKKASGQVKQIGFSFHGRQNDFMELLDAYAWDFVQIQYNYMNENYQAGTVGLMRAHELGLPVIVMEPLLGGKLAKNLPKDAAQVFTDANARMGTDFSPAQWAMKWVFNHSEATVVLSGMNAQAQLDENVAVTDTLPGSLDAAGKEVFAPVIAAMEHAYRVPCTGCGYCMPCPNGVNIPACFMAYNMRYILGFIQGMQMYIVSNGSGKGAASQCVKCGACEKKCPQAIKITSELDDVKKAMEPWWMRGAMKIAGRL
jgi:predicted aldo/keto reductase-like oxidoreductase